jgi:hypothetical protein
VLPRGFDKVMLGSRERAAIVNCGRNPDRREADVDDRDCPINTGYVIGEEEEEEG